MNVIYAAMSFVIVDAIGWYIDCSLPSTRGDKSGRWLATMFAGLAVAILVGAATA